MCINLMRLLTEMTAHCHTRWFCFVPPSIFFFLHIHPHNHSFLAFNAVYQLYWPYNRHIHTSPCIHSIQFAVKRRITRMAREKSTHTTFERHKLRWNWKYLLPRENLLWFLLVKPKNYAARYHGPHRTQSTVAYFTQTWSKNPPRKNKCVLIFAKKLFGWFL